MQQCVQTCSNTRGLYVDYFRTLQTTNKIIGAKESQRQGKNFRNSGLVDSG
jgi:hypothetical protein